MGKDGLAIHHGEASQKRRGGHSRRGGSWKRGSIIQTTLSPIGSGRLKGVKSREGEEGKYSNCSWLRR